MTDKFEQFIGQAKEMRLTAQEKEDVRRLLLASIQTAPVAHKRAPHLFIRVLVPAFAGLFLLLGGAAFAARNARPDDFLYPVRVGVSERVQQALIFDDDKEIDWELSQMDQRMAEEEQLAESFQP